MSDQHGHETEDTVEHLCFRLFGADFVLRSPRLIEQSGTKELTDILLIVDDTAIVVQSKSLVIDIADLDQTRFNRIRKKQEHAKRQLNTTLNAQARNACVRATNSVGVTFDLDWTLIKRKRRSVSSH
jgi:hypothetical protein